MATAEIQVYFRTGATTELSALVAQLPACDQKQLPQDLHSPAYANRVQSRHLMRQILRQRYTSQAETEIELGPQGRPRLRSCPLSVNLSHSQNFFCLAISEQVNVGIDLEVQREVHPGLAKRLMSTQEAEHFTDLSNLSLLRLWTAKEAAVKSLGLNLGMGLQKMSVNREFSEVEILTEAKVDVTLHSPYLTGHIDGAQNGDSLWRTDLKELNLASGVIAHLAWWPQLRPVSIQINKI